MFQFGKGVSLSEFSDASETGRALSSCRMRPREAQHGVQCGIVMVHAGEREASERAQRLAEQREIPASSEPRIGSPEGVGAEVCPESRARTCSKHIVV